MKLSRLLQAVDWLTDKVYTGPMTTTQGKEALQRRFLEVATQNPRWVSPDGGGEGLLALDEDREV